MADISLRKLFDRRGLANVEISVRTSLANHRGVSRSVREVDKSLRTPNHVSGFALGCRKASSSKISVPGLLKRELGNVLPAWVNAAKADQRDRILEGMLLKSKITAEDFPLAPWHTSLDWNFFVHADPQYTYLVSKTSIDHNSQKFGKKGQEIIECEWESSLVPLWAVPQEDCRIWMVGRWIYDCGHPEGTRHRTEIHPPKAMASFRSEAEKLPGNAAPTPVTRTALYISRRGGYFDDEINKDYLFDLHLPPKPHPDAVPRFRVAPKTGDLPVDPQIRPFPEDQPKLLRVMIPLRKSKRIEEYGAIIFGGWSDPDGSAASGVRRVRVTIDRIRRTRTEATEKPGPLQPGGNFRTWHLHLCVNGRWTPVQLKSANTPVNFSVDLMLSREHTIRITAFGIEKRNIFDFLGSKTGLDPTFASKRKTHEERKEALKEIAEAFRKGIFRHGPPLSDSNISVGLFSKVHSAGDQGSFTEDSASPANSGGFKNEQKHNNYVIEYRIQNF